MSPVDIRTFEDLLQTTEDPLRAVAQALRDIIFEVDPKVCEVVRLGDRAATFGVGSPKMIDGYAYIQPHKTWVNLGFDPYQRYGQGYGQPDPNGLLEGAGAKMRHAKIHLLDDARQPAIRALIECALAKRKETSGQSVTTSGNKPGPGG